jgi:hypothetical protein
VPPEEDEASGKSQRQDGVSAPKSGAIAAPRKGHQMSKIEINGFKYSEHVLESEKTARESRRAHSQANAEFKAETDPKRKAALAYDNWMRTRSAGSFEHYGIQQKQEIHEIAFLYHDGIVCTCGLIADRPAEDRDNELALWNAPGHIKTATRELVSILVVKNYSSKVEGFRFHYWCSECDDLGATIPTGTGKVSAVGLKAIRASHKCKEANLMSELGRNAIPKQPRLFESIMNL